MSAKQSSTTAKKTKPASTKGKKVSKGSTKSSSTKDVVPVTETTKTPVVAIPTKTSTSSSEKDSTVVATDKVAVPSTHEDGNLLQQIEGDITSLTEKLGQFRGIYLSLTSELKKLQKNMARHIRENSKKNKKKKVNSGDKPKRAPSGFAKPALISKELCVFLGKPANTEMARTEVTKYLTSYIKEHNLQDQANKRKILPDDKLKKLLNLEPTDEVTYFNLQKYMKVHFPKSAAALAAEAAALAATATTASSTA